MKKRIGTLRGKPIVEGDDNLISIHELKSSVVDLNNESYHKIYRYKPEELVCYIGEIVLNPDTGRSNMFSPLYEIPVVAYSKHDPFISKIELKGFKYNEDTTIYFMIQPKDKTLFGATVHNSKEDEDHSSNLDEIYDDSRALAFTAALDEDEGSVGSDYYQIIYSAPNKSKYNGNILDTEAIIELRIRYAV